MSQLVVKVNNIDIYPFILNFASKHTQQAYMSDLQSFFGFFDERKVFFNHPSDLQLIHFIAYRDHLRQSGMARKTVARKIASVKSLMKWFQENGHIQSNPAASLKVPKAEVEAPTNALTDEEVRAMLAAPDASTKDGALHSLVLYFLFMFGIRRSELVGIKVNDIYSVNSKLVLKVRGKGNKDREIPFNAKAQQALDTYYKFVTLQSDSYVFDLSTEAVYAIFKRYAARAGIKKNVSPHSARATVATKSLENNAPITEVADLLGHSDISTTQIYWKRRQGLDNSPVHKLDY
jgi:site-specific recombinase XerD